MVAIQTFAELLTEKYDDSSFRNFFTHTVSQEIKRLNELGTAHCFFHSTFLQIQCNRYS